MTVTSGRQWQEERTVTREGSDKSTVIKGEDSDKRRMVSKGEDSDKRKTVTKGRE